MVIVRPKMWPFGSYYLLCPGSALRLIFRRQDTKIVLVLRVSLLKVDGMVGSLNTEGCATKYIRAKHTGLTLISNNLQVRVGNKTETLDRKTFQNGTKGIQTHFVSYAVRYWCLHRLAYTRCLAAIAAKPAL